MAVRLVARPAAVLATLALARVAVLAAVAALMMMAQPEAALAAVLAMVRVWRWECGDAGDQGGGQGGQRGAGTAAVSPKLALNAGAVRPDRLASHAASGARQPVPGKPGEGQYPNETRLGRLAITSG
jgi:hypothetical protein